MIDKIIPNRWYELYSGDIVYINSNYRAKIASSMDPEYMHLFTRLGKYYGTELIASHRYHIKREHIKYVEPPELLQWL
jgi:hypothetical protein